MIIAGQSGTNRKNLSKAKKMDFVCKKADTFRISFDVYYIDEDGYEQAYDFTNCILQMQIKKKATDRRVILYMPISINGNTITLLSDSESMNIESGRYVYDIEMYDTDGENITILYGSFIVLQDVTDFIRVIEMNFGINFENDIVEQLQLKYENIIGFKSGIISEFQPVFVSNNELKQAIIATAFEWNKQYPNIALTNNIIYDILQWIVLRWNINLNSQIIASGNINIEYDIIITNTINYTIQEYD